MTDEFEGAVAEAEGGRFVEAFGKRYAVADKMAAMPLLKYAWLSKRGMDTADEEAGAVMYDLLGGCFTEEAFVQFEQDSTEARADLDDLMAVVTQVIAVMASVPPMSPSVSADGPSTTLENSMELSSSEPDEASYADRKRALGLVPIVEALTG